MSKKRILAEDVMSMTEFAKIRQEKRRALIPTKQRRRVGVGPCAMFYFENYETMWFQVHEMLFIEGGGKEQLEGELEAYNPLIPNGRELVATLMFEIENPTERAYLLKRLTGVEETISLSLEGQQIFGVVEEKVGQPRSDGKVSSVHFVHFPFTDEQVFGFKNSGGVGLQIDHGFYSYDVALDQAMINELAADFEIS